jgi:hypothetical protein
LGHVLNISRPARAAALAAALAATLALGGCGGVEFQGKIFDAVGLSEVGGPQPDVRMAERPPLLLPPDPKALPPPGSGVAAATAREDWPKNPEVAQTEVIKAKQDAKAAATASSAADTNSANPLKGKNNPLVGKWWSKRKEAEPLDEVPEPDPADKPAEDEDVAEAKPQTIKPHVPQEITPAPDELFKPVTPDSYKNPNVLW